MESTPFGHLDYIFHHRFCFESGFCIDVIKQTNEQTLKSFGFDREEEIVEAMACEIQLMVDNNERRK